MPEPPAVPAGTDETPESAVDFGSFVADSADVNTVETIDGVYRYVSRGCQPTYGWNPTELEGRLADDFVHPDDLNAVRTARREQLTSHFSTTTYRFRCRDGSYRWTESTGRLVEKLALSMVVSTLRDTHARQAREEILLRQARTDPLTGLANRSVLMDRLHQGIRRLQRTGGGLALLYVDVDRFKVINDSLGHRIGDQLLMTLAGRLAHALRPTDTIARLGGDEFAIVAEEVADERAALELADRIIVAGGRAFQIGGEAFECTFSVGIAWTRDADRDPGELLREADLALYRAKDHGRDRAELFDEHLQATAAGRLMTKQLLGRAITERRIVVEYQPVQDLRSDVTVGVEALVRVREIDGRLLYPASFIDVAEETGQLIAIDEIVLTDAIERARRWHAEFPESGFAEVAINITARHLADSLFPQAVIDRLDEVGLPHDHLHIELTERTLIEATSSAMQGLRALRDAELRVGLDDFGTGFSSLAYLRQFPLDFVKIDRAFVQDLERDPRERAIVQAVVALAHALGLTVVAEGVETLSQLRVLKELECDRAQGFLFSSSKSPERISEMVADGAFAVSALPRD